jgi:6-phosphogluconolactonase
LSELKVFATPTAAAGAAAEVLADRAGAGGHIALAGGSTPAEAYKMAAARRRDWRGAVLWYGDDRVVPPDHEHSNHLMVTRSLLALIPQEMAPELMRVQTEAGPEAAAADYEARLRERLGNAPVLDLILLGLGPDAHTASLFPGKPALGEKRRLVAPVPEPGLPPIVPRVTVTFPLINAAAEVVFLVAGADKAEAMRRAFGPEPDPQAPAAHVRPASGRLTVLCDEAAAAQL